MMEEASEGGAGMIDSSNELIHENILGSPCVQRM